MTELAEKPKRAETEGGTFVDHQEHEVDNALTLLAINGGDIKTTCQQLEQAGASLHRNTLAKWRNHLFPKRYARLRADLGKEISADLAGRAFETAYQADEAVKKYVERSMEKINEVEPNHLAKSAQALSMVHANSIEKARLLRNEPDSITETRSVEELIGVLVRTGVVERDEPIDAQVVEGDQ